MEFFLASLTDVFSILNLFLLVVGTSFGILCGALPGVSISMAIVLALPFTYTMGSINAILFLVAVYIGGTTGGSATAILLKTPGTPAALTTTFDGYPMAMKGEAGKALGLAITASSIGGIFSAICMVIAAPLLANVALKFQAAEYFSLAVLGLSCITSIGSKNQLKAVISALLGLLIAYVGLDPINGAERFTYGQGFLMSGIDYIPVMIGSFAIAEVYKNLEKVSGENEDEMTTQNFSMKFMPLKEILKMWKAIFQSSSIGTIIGMLPAAGGSIASLVSYSQVRKTSKTPELFGKGAPEGIMAAECSNNAAVGGSMVPTLVLGIPGSPTAAIIMAAFMMHGLVPGPLLLKNQPELLNSIFIGIILSSLLLFLVGRYITREFARVLKLPYPLLATLIIMLGTIGAYSLKNSYNDVIIMFIFSLVGYFFNKYNYSASAMILGLILGSIMENSFRLQLLVSNGNLMTFINRPISLAVLLMALFAFISPLFKKKKNPILNKA